MKSSKIASKGISIRIIHVIALICAAAIVALLFFTTRQSSNLVSTLSSETDNYIVRQKAAHDLMLKSKTDIDNPTAWMISAIKENYKAPKAKKTANKFTDFNQNSYDFDELEKQLVDN